MVRLIFCVPAYLVAAVQHELQKRELGDFCYPSASRGTAVDRLNLSVRLVVREWMSHKLVTYVVAILLREQLRFKVELVSLRSSKGSMWRASWLDWIKGGEFDVDMENWHAFERDNQEHQTPTITPATAAYTKGANALLAEPRRLGYVGRPGLYVLAGAAQRHIGPPSFYRFYGPRGVGLMDGFAKINVTESCGAMGATRTSHSSACRIGAPLGYWAPDYCSDAAAGCVEVLMAPEYWDPLFFERLVLNLKLRMVFSYQTTEQIQRIQEHLTPAPHERVFYSFVPNWGTHDDSSIRISFPDPYPGCTDGCDYPEVILAKVVALRLKTNAPEAFYMLEKFELSLEVMMSGLIAKTANDMSEESIKDAACSFLLERPSFASNFIPRCAIAPEETGMRLHVGSGRCHAAPIAHTFRCFAAANRPTSAIKSGEVVRVAMRSWLSHRLIRNILAILLHEYLGYEVVFQPWDEDRHDWSFMQHPAIVDVDPERWHAHDPATVKKWTVEHDAVVEPMPLGVIGRSGLYVLPHSLQSYPFADYYAFFVGGTARSAGFETLNTTKLDLWTRTERPCLSSPQPEGSYWWCDPHGFYRTPACLATPHTCVEAVMAYPSYDTGIFEQLVKNNGLELTMAYYGASWGAVVLKRAMARRSIVFYAWQPHPLLARLNATDIEGQGRISFPETSYACGSFRDKSPNGTANCDYRSQMLMKLMTTRLWKRAPEAAYMITEFMMTNQQLDHVFARHVEGGGNMSDETASCWFVSEHKQQLASFVPECISRPLRTADVRNGSIVFLPSERKCRPIACRPNEQIIHLSSEPICRQCTSGRIPSEDQLECRTCPAGQSADHSGASCIPCLPGTYSDPEAGFERCELCHNGTYNPLPGQKSCAPCPVGGNCDGRGRKVFLAGSGFFLLGSMDSVMSNLKREMTSGEDFTQGKLGIPGIGPVKCPVPWACAGNNTCSASSDGRASVYGPLCASCSPGFARAGAYEPCAQCPSLSMNLGLVCLVSLGYLSSVFLWARLNEISSVRSKGVRFVVPKIFVNFCVLLSCISQAIDGKKLSARSSNGPAASQTFSFGLTWALYLGNILQNSAHLTLAMPCLLGSFSWAPEHAGIILTWLIVPSVMFALLMFSAVAMALESFAVKLRGSSAVASASEGDTHARKSISDDVVAVPTTFLKALVHRFAPKAVIAVYILHPIVNAGFFSAFECSGVDEDTGLRLDTHRLLSRMEIDCESAAHRQWQVAAGMGLVTWSCGIPAFLGYALWRHRHELSTAKVFHKYGFIYKGYQYRYWYQELVHMIQKSLIKFFAICPWVNSNVRTVLLLAWSLYFTARHFLQQFYDNRCYFALDRLELYSNVTLVALLLGRVLELESQADEKWDRVSGYAYLPGMCGLWLLVIQSIYLLLRPDCWPVDGCSALPRCMSAQLAPLCVGWGPSEKDGIPEQLPELGSLEHVTLDPTCTVRRERAQHMRPMLARVEHELLMAFCAEAAEVLLRRHEACFKEAPRQICMPTFLVHFERLLMGCMIQACRTRYTKRQRLRDQNTWGKKLSAAWIGMRSRLLSLVNDEHVSRQSSLFSEHIQSSSTDANTQQTVSVEELYAALVHLKPRLLDPRMNIHRNQLQRLCESSSSIVPFDVSAAFREEAHLNKIAAWNKLWLSSDETLSQGGERVETSRSFESADITMLENASLQFAQEDGECNKSARALGSDESCEDLTPPNPTRGIWKVTI